jgi:hypothetical protein
MSLRTRWRAWAALTAAVVIAVLVLSLSQCSPDSADPGAGPASRGGSATVGTGHLGTFTVTGHTVREISPGVSAPFNVELENSSGYALVITEIRIRIREVLAPHADARHPCTTEDFAVVQGSHDLRIALGVGASTSLMAAGIDRSDWPSVGMTNTSSDQDGCKGAVVRFDNTATGRQAPP